MLTEDMFCDKLKSVEVPHTSVRRAQLFFWERICKKWKNM